MLIVACASVSIHSLQMYVVIADNTDYSHREGGYLVRLVDFESHRASLSQQALQIDFHEFIEQARWLSDIGLAEAFDLGRNDVEKLRRKLQRN